MTSQQNVFEHIFKVLSLYLEARIRIRIKVKGRIRIRIKVTRRIRIHIKLTKRIRIRIKVMRIRNTRKKNPNWDDRDITTGDKETSLRERRHLNRGWRKHYGDN
jgi:hypothetical protein